MVDFSLPKVKAFFDAEVRKRMNAPFFMGRSQATMLVAVLIMSDPDMDASLKTILADMEIDDEDQEGD